MAPLSLLAACIAMAALPAALAASSQSYTGLLQMITYVKRHPGYTREESWEYWDTQHAPKVAPLATHFNITRYQQASFIFLALELIMIQVGGKIPPTEAGASAPASNQLVDFDGIAMFLYESAADLTAMLSHPYYLGVVEPDEHVFTDKSAFGSGMVATYIGNHVEVVNGRDVWQGDEETRRRYRKIFDSY